MGSGAVGSGGSGGGSSGGSGDAAASNVQEQDAKCPTSDKWSGADLSDNEKDSGGAGSNSGKRPRPARWAEMIKRQRKNWKLRHLKGDSGRDSSPRANETQKPTHSESTSVTGGPKEVAAQPASAGEFLVESRHCSGPQ